MNIPESFYVALCMTVLLLGVVYWFWSQNQYIQRKMNLLENIVYELKELCTNQTSFVGPPAELKTTRYEAPVERMTSDADVHATLMKEVQPMSGGGVETVKVHRDEGVAEFEVEDIEAPVEKPLTLEQPFFPSEEHNDDLQPGGVGSGLRSIEPQEQSTSLDSMTVKELRRLAEQRGIENANELRKKELIAKLRALATPSVLSAFDNHEHDHEHEELQTIELE